MPKNILSQGDSWHCVIATTNGRGLLGTESLNIESNNLLLYFQHPVIKKHFAVFFLTFC